MLETQIAIEDIKSESVPLDEEFWVEMREGDPSSPRLRLKITYEQNEVLKWEAEEMMLVSEIRNDAGILRQVRMFIEQLSAPFGFLVR